MAMSEGASEHVANVCGLKVIQSMQRFQIHVYTRPKFKKMAQHLSHSAPLFAPSSPLMPSHNSSVSDPSSFLPPSYPTTFHFTPQPSQGPFGDGIELSFKA